MHAKKLNDEEIKKVVGGSACSVYRSQKYKVKVFRKGVRDYADRYGAGYAYIADAFDDGTFILKCEEVVLLARHIDEFTDAKGLKKLNTSDFEYMFTPGYDYRLVFRDDEMDVTVAHNHPNK